MKFTVLTLFPEIFKVLENYSILGRALEAELFQLEAIDIRQYSNNKHGKVDDYSYGGGPGMLMKPEPVVEAIEKNKGESGYVICLSARGKVLTQEKLLSLSKLDHLVLVNGHYEGIDERVIDHFVDEELSIGDYVLSGGEIASLVLIDGVARLLDGVLSNKDSAEEESHTKGLLEYPQYTRPYDFRGYKVPDILLSGNHEEIADYRRKSAIRQTIKKRPDLLEKANLSQEEWDYIDKIINNNEEV